MRAQNDDPYLDTANAAHYLGYSTSTLEWWRTCSPRRGPRYYKMAALGQLLRDQGQSFERLLKSYTALKERTTVVLSINESPEWSKLKEVLFVVFEQHPDAFDMFRSLVQERRLRLE